MISKKQNLSLADIEEFDLDETKLAELDEVKPEEFFKDQAKIGTAFLQCLIENDTEAFIEILDTYLIVNCSRVTRNAQIGRSTVQGVFSKKGNPRLKTIAKIVHHESQHDNHYKS